MKKWIIISLFITLSSISIFLIFFTKYESNSTTIKNIFIGDSRTAIMCSFLTDDWQNCSYSSGGAYYYGNDIYIAEGAQSYTWFVETAVPAVNEIIDDNPYITYNIISNMGINMLLADLDNYISKYTELATNEWSGQNIIIVSVNPVSEEDQEGNMYFVSTSDIEYFNMQIKNSTTNLKNVSYCDVYNKIINNFTAEDGVHYGADTYQFIYKLILSCLST